MADNQAVSAKADIGTGTREMYSYSEKWMTSGRNKRFF